MIHFKPNLLRECKRKRVCFKARFKIKKFTLPKVSGLQGWELSANKLKKKSKVTKTMSFLLKKNQTKKIKIIKKKYYSLIILSKD